jgi:hypothetical protein
MTDFGNLDSSSQSRSPKAGEIWQLQRVVRSPLKLSASDKQRLYSEPARQFMTDPSSRRYVMIVRSLEPVPDRVAHAFLMHFLTHFSQGQSFYQSVRDAREQLQNLEEQYPCADWLPMIVQNPAEIPPTWQTLKAA